MSTFSSLNAATTALWAQRRGLDVTGQNIANVNTEGYSRQRADLRAISSSTTPAFFSTSSGIGAGVNADDVIRIRDAFLESRGHTEHSTNARLTTENETLELVEQAFREPGDTGIQSLLSDMWSGWGDVANNPQDLPARSQLLRRLETLVGGFHATASNLDGQWSQTRENFEVLVADVNATAASIAELNQSIKQATQSGMPANELSDRRDLLVLKLAEQVGASVRPAGNGVVDVIVGGLTLVAGSTSSRLAVAGATDPDDASVDPLRVVTATGNFNVRPGGTAEGQVSTLNTIIPTYRAKLDGLAADLATALNGGHGSGYDLDGLPGTDLLSGGGGPVTAASLTVLTADPRRIAASAVPPGAGGPALDNGNADAISQLRLLSPGVDTGYRQMIVDLGVQAAVTGRNLDIQSVITAQVDAARESVAGVNIDEEMANMLSFQHAYSAAARVVTAIDESLDVLINRTGVVGR